MSQISDEKLYTLNEILKILNIPRHRLNYLFDSRKLRSEDLLILPNGHRVYRESDLLIIKKALWEVSTK